MDPTYTKSCGQRRTKTHRNVPRVVRQHADHQVDLTPTSPLRPKAMVKRYFPVSVCTSDYCFMDGPNTFRYRCDGNDECCMKENVVVQALPAPSTSAAECLAE